MGYFYNNLDLPVEVMVTRASLEVYRIPGSVEMSFQE